MKFLVDADVLSEATTPEPRRSVIQWLAAHEPELGICSVTLGELRLGILQLDDGRRRRSLDRWFEAGVALLAVVEFDEPAALLWAQLVADQKRRSVPMPLMDSFVAATALSRNMTLVTGNVRHFRHTGVKLLNPFR